MRNPDSGGSRYTSLAWAAVCGHEDVFEFLLSMGHDDEELSKDSEKNTILCLLADVKGNASLGSSQSTPVDMQGAAMRMAKLYRDRFPFIIDWSNQHGKTALHNAALRGNDDFVRMLCDLGADIDLPDLQGNTALHYASAWGHIPCVTTLIERGCSFNVKNNDGFTASDYAYSNNTFDALQDTARNIFEVNKYTRVVAQQQARRAERSAYGYTDAGELPRRNHGMYGARRLRSGSGTTSTSDSTDYDGAMSGSAPGSSQLSGGHSSSGSLPRPPPSNGTILTPIPASNYVNRARNHSNSSSHAPSHMSRPSVSSTTTNSRGIANSSGATLSVKSSSTALSPIASRMLERDAGAMAQYRVRSGSHSSTTTGEASNSLLPSSNLNATQEPTTPISPLPELPTTDFRTRTIPRSLRPSLSAASLRQTPLPSIIGVASGSNPRIRAGTLNHPSSSGVSTPKTPPMATTFLQTLKRPVMAVLPGSRGGDQVAHSNAVNGHTRRPSGSLLRDIRTDPM
ncbi:hypothetical protein FS842_008409 [Serendipita sp. 407]|nr:hypothetical protein FS842_008409 [Serendipita sp. 407]